MRLRVAFWAFVIGLFLSPFAGTALAGGPEPYSGWAFDVGRANEKNDLNGLTALSAAKPEFARVWFYGQIFDLINPRIPEAERAVLGQRLAQIAGVLRSQGDNLPALYIDRIATGRLGADATRSRKNVDAWLNMARVGNLLPVRLATVEDPDLARGIFYGLIFRADLVGKTKFGSAQKATMLKVAQALAEGFALGGGDMQPWTCLGKYHSGAVPIGQATHIELLVTEGLNAVLKPDLAKTKVQLMSALNAANSSRGGSLYVAFIMNGAANATAWLKDQAGARSLRVRVLQGVRPLKLPKLTALVARQMVEDHLADNQLDDMIPYTRELRELGPVVEGNAKAVATLLTAAKALEAAARERSSAGRLQAALRVLREAERVYEFVTKDALIALGHMQAEVAGLRVQQQRTRAELIRLEGWIAIRRGKYDEARAAFQQVIQVYQTVLGDTLSAATAQTSLAHSILAAGDTDKALAQTQAVQASLGQSGDPVARATNYLVQGWARLGQGELAKAYGNANFALQVLRNGGVSESQPKLRARLHALAASVLDGAGLAADAAERMGYALRLAPTDRELARMGAVSRIAAGDADGALAALEPLMNTPHAQVASIWKGCLLVRAGRLDEGLATLDVVVPQLTLPHLMHTHIVGRTCITAGYLKKNDVAAARRALQPARARMLEYPHPSLIWKVHALDGEINIKEGRLFDAAGSWRQAVDRFMDFLGERPWRGTHIAYRDLALPSSPVTALKDLPIVLGKIAKKDSANIAVHGEAAIKLSRWIQQRSMAPSNRAFDGNQASSPANRLVHAQLTRLDETRKVLEDVAVTQSDRAAASMAFRQTIEFFREASRGMRATDPAGYDYYAPEPRDVVLAGNEAMLRYLVTDKTTHLWVVGPGIPTKLYVLPGRAKLARIVESARGVINSAPAEWDVSKRRPKDPNKKDWKTLAKPVKTLLPFMRDKALMETLSARQIRVVPDGPLVRFPLDALVLKAPSRRSKGAPPQFVGGRLQLHYMILDQTRPSVTNGSSSIALLGELGASSGGCPYAASGDPCAQGRAGNITGALKGAIGTNQVVASLEGPALQSAGILGALRAHRLTVVGGPTDLATGTFVTAAPAAEQMLGRLGGEQVAALKGISSDVFLANGVGVGLELEHGAGLRRLHASLRAAGAKTVVLREHGAEIDQADYAKLGSYLAAGASLRDALGSIRLAEMTTPYDLENGGPVRHHPYYWARSIVYSDSSAPAEIVIPAVPVPAQVPEAATPAEAAPAEAAPEAAAPEAAAPEAAAPEAAAPEAAAPEEAAPEAAAPEAAEPEAAAEEIAPTVHGETPEAPAEDSEEGDDEGESEDDAEAPAEQPTQAKDSDPKSDEAEEEESEEDAAEGSEDE